MKYELFTRRCDDGLGAELREERYNDMMILCRLKVRSERNKRD